jgi:hypothetical protein
MGRGKPGLTKTGSMALILKLHFLKTKSGNLTVLNELNGAPDRTRTTGFEHEHRLRLITSTITKILVSTRLEFLKARLQN